MRVVRLRLQRFRGFEALRLNPSGDVLVVGEPRAGRSDIVAALSRVLDYRSTRRQADPLDVHRPSGAAAVLAPSRAVPAGAAAGDRNDSETADGASEAGASVDTEDTATPDRNLETRPPLLTEVEVTLADLDPSVNQAFSQYLEAIDPITGEVLESGDDGLPVGTERGLRLCYRLEYDESTGDAEHWVDYPMASNPSTGDFVRARASDRQQLPFVHLQDGQPLQLRAEGTFRSVLNELDPLGTAAALASLGTDIQAATTALSQSPAVAAGLERVLRSGTAGLLGLEGTPLARNLGFITEDGTMSALLRGLQPAVRLDRAGLLPLSSHGSTASTVLAIAEAIVAAAVPGAIVASDDFGDSLDTGAAEYLAGLLRRRAGQLWLTTRRPEAARAFPPSQMTRLTRHTGVRRAHVLPDATDRRQLAARRHLHPQILAALSATSIVIVEGPHDLAGYGAIEQRQLMRDGTQAISAVGGRLVAAGLGQEGGKDAIRPLARLARDLGYRVIALIDHDKPGVDADRERDQLLPDCDVVVRLPPRTAVERALVYNVPPDELRLAAQSVFDLFGVAVDLAAVDERRLGPSVIEHLKDKGGLHAPFVAALGDNAATPPLAVASLDAVAQAANPRFATNIIEVSLPAATS